MGGNVFDLCFGLPILRDALCCFDSDLVLHLLIFPQVRRTLSLVLQVPILADLNVDAMHMISPPAEWLL